MGTVLIGAFDLVFVDRGYSAKLHEPAAADFVLDMVLPGGMLVLDDLTAEREESDPLALDAKREFALRNPKVIGVELYPPVSDGTLGARSPVCWL